MAGIGPEDRRNGCFTMPADVIPDKLHPPTAILKRLIEKIEEVSPKHVDQALHEAASTFKAICVDVETMKNVMLNLHCKALSNPGFGEKYITVLGQLSGHAVNNVPVRSELLSFIENEFKVKETMFQSDTTKFVNSVMLLGYVYNLVKIHGVPLKVLAVPMLEYLNLLLEGREEHHRVFAIQVLLNGEKIFRTESLGRRLEMFKQSMRRALIARELSPKSRCWILLALDFISNDLKPLSEQLRIFYLEALGDDSMHVNHLLKHPVSTPGKSGAGDSYARGMEDVFKDIDNPTIPPEVLNAASTGCKSVRFHRFPNFGGKVNEREGKSSKPAGGRESLPGNHDDDDLYGLQIERDKIKKPLVKRN